MGSYVWGIQVFCSRNKAPPHFKPSPWTEDLNTLGITSHCSDSFHIKPITPGHPIPKISTHLTIFWGDTWKTEFVKTVHRQEKTSAEKKSDGLHKKWSIELWTILLFELLLCCHTAARCMKRTWYLLLKKYSKSLLIQEWFTQKEFYKLPVSAEKKSWRFPYFFKSYCQRKIGTFFWATLYIFFFILNLWKRKRFLPFWPWNNRTQKNVSLHYTNIREDYWEGLFHLNF